MNSPEFLRRELMCNRLRPETHLCNRKPFNVALDRERQGQLKNECALLQARLQPGGFLISFGAWLLGCALRPNGDPRKSSSGNLNRVCKECIRRVLARPEA